jgi:predicted esterase
MSRKLLALHGYRTSGQILSMQTAGMRHHTGMECVFPDAPHPASGPADLLIQQFYSSYKYYEWYVRKDDDIDSSKAMMNQSLDFLVNYVAKHGPFEGILGFSQGAAMMTLLLNHYQITNQIFPFKYAIAIGAVDPFFLDSVSITNNIIMISMWMNYLLTYFWYWFVLFYIFLCR